MGQLLVADTFFPSLSKLEAKEQARAIDFVARFQRNPANPGVSLERLTARSTDIWSGRISRDLRAILYKDGDSWAVLYADHHDQAYRWAERRDIGRHPVTGSLQIIETVETIREVAKTLEAAVPTGAQPVFAEHDSDYLLSLGVPETWLPAIRKIVSDEQLFEAISRLPEELGERLLDLAAGEFVTPPVPTPLSAPVADNEDTRRRFFVADNEAELTAALEAPLERWIAFLHPSQRTLVEASVNGPVKVTGSAGTGKTVVAMHRARHLARQGKRVLLTSFVTTLCKNLERSLAMLCTPEERKQITVSTVHKQALVLVHQVEPRLQPAAEKDVDGLVARMALSHASSFNADFVQAEWKHVIQMQGITRWSEYRSAKRTGRGRPLSVRDRKTLWTAFEAVQTGLASRGLVDWPGLCVRAANALQEGRASSSFDAVIVDEVQDPRPPALRLVAALGNELMVVGDAGQRIYPGGFSLAALGINVRGRSRILRINYRTTEQIRRSADRVLGDAADDLDGSSEPRAGTKSLLSGPAPTLSSHATREAELAAAVEQIKSLLVDGVALGDVAVFARSGSRATAAVKALELAGLTSRRLADDDAPHGGAVSVGTMHRAKGLEFKVVLVLDCGASVMPSPHVLRQLDDPQDCEDAEARERRLLYVAMTRARDQLYLSWSGKPSPFIEPLLNRENAG
ncbi:MAG: AAA family ATPase [Myxococcales bacterium]|nr:AAA family ATPase [Myxococcales bacterium]